VIRHDAVVWAYAAAAQALGVEVHQDTEVVGIDVDGGRCRGVRTTRGEIAAGAVVCAVGGYVSKVAALAGVRLPIVTHPLQAFVTEPYKPLLDQIVLSTEFLTYISQTSRGEVLVGSEIEPYASYSTRSTYAFLAETAARCIDQFPFMAKLGILRQWAGVCDMTPDYSPIMGLTEVDRFYLDAGWGTWGFKAVPAAGTSVAALVATERVPDVIAPFALSRFAADRVIADRSSAGTH
jgi:sarcosine oxidase subunit beta